MLCWTRPCIYWPLGECSAELASVYTDHHPTPLSRHDTRFPSPPLCPQVWRALHCSSYRSNKSGRSAPCRNRYHCQDRSPQESRSVHPSCFGIHWRSHHSNLEIIMIKICDDRGCLKSKLLESLFYRCICL